MKFKCKVLQTTSPSLTIGKIYLSDYIDDEGIAMISDDDGHPSVLWNQEYRIIRERNNIPLVNEDDLIGEGSIIYHNKEK